ncbi:MAG: hypothetical protein R6V04_00655 [bacterium]
MHPVDPSTKGTYYIDKFFGSTTPQKISLLDKNSKEMKVLLWAETPLKDYKLGEVEFLTLQNKQGIKLNARMILPVDFNPGNKYPVIIYVYGGYTVRW